MLNRNSLMMLKNVYMSSILDKNPEHCWIIEPIEDSFKTIYNNLKNHQVSFVRGAIAETPKVKIHWFGEESDAPGITFKDFVKYNCIQKINFLKIDCEGGEYLVFNEENFDYIKNNVKKIAGEFHLRTKQGSSLDNLNERFRNFRDNFLTKFDKYEVRSVDGVNIKWDLFNEHFLEYYQEIIIYIDNR